MSNTLIEAAKLPNIGYSEKDWDKTVASVTPDFVYDEVATHRKSENAEGYLEMCKGWATAFPESRATFHNAYVTGNTVVLELTIMQLLVQRARGHPERVFGVGVRQLHQK